MSKFSERVEDIKQQTDELRLNLTRATGVDSTGYNIKKCAEIIGTKIINSFDLSDSTATEEDVRAGKTFWSKTNELKTGTFDDSLIKDLQSKINIYVSGVGSVQIEIPENISRIRKYFFSIDKEAGQSTDLFYCENLTIPRNIDYIGERAFYKTNLTGTLTIPETCSQICTQAFNGVPITEAYVYGGLISSSTYVFANNANLKKVVFGGNVNYIPNYLFSGCSSLKEIVFPATTFTFSSLTFNNCQSIEIVKFTGQTPPKFQSNTFIYIQKASLLVPYYVYDKYINASNFLAYGNPVYGYGEFTTGDKLPNAIEDYSVVWYKTLEDAQLNTNPVTSADEDATFYAVFTETIA